MNQLSTLNVKTEKEKIITFLKKTLRDQGKQKIVLGLSGGIDSVVCFYLLEEALDPKNILIAYLPHFKSKFKDFKNILEEAKIPNQNIYRESIKKSVAEFKNILNLQSEDKLRLGNIMARIRMIMLYDLAKKHDALVLGTEDKSEFLLGYFTRFGDAASDIEPIRHLYKTQVYQLAKALGVPEKIIKQKSSPDLWIGQTAEKELGFSYEEADNVLRLYFDKKMSIEKIKKLNFPNAEKVIARAQKNSFKHGLPYIPKPN
jgi:NAD+ synthase